MHQFCSYTDLDSSPSSVTYELWGQRKVTECLQASVSSFGKWISYTAELVWTVENQYEPPGT